MFKANNKDTRMMSIMFFLYVVIVKLGHISHLFLEFTVNFQQLDAC